MDFLSISLYMMKIIYDLSPKVYSDEYGHLRKHLANNKLIQ